MLNIEDMLDVSMVKDTTDERKYSEGYYNNRVAVYGLYLKAKKGTLLEGLEIYAKSKFKLESDPENYAQEARLETCLALEKYYNSVCNKEDLEDDEKAKAWVYTVVKNKLDNMSKAAKSNVSYYDYKKQDYIINNIIYLDKKSEEGSDEYLKVIMEIEDIKKSMSEKSKSEFKIWIDNNKSKILTKKQIGYLDGEIIVNDKGNEHRIKENIISRVDKSFHESYINDNRIKKYEENLNNIKKITECYTKEDICNNIKKMEYEDNYYVIDIIYKNIDFKYCKQFTSIINGDKVNNNRIFNEILKILIKKEEYLNKKIKTTTLNCIYK